MASMVFASPLSAQSLVKLRTNSKYPPSSCYVPSYSKANSSYNVHLSYKFSHIESSKSSFTTGDGFSKFPPLLKFPRVASTLSPSLTIIKACSIYRYSARKLKKNQDNTIERKEIIPLSIYNGKVLLIVNIPQQGSEWSQIKYFNDLRQRVLKKHKKFEVLGFIYDKKELDEKSEEERTDEQILKILDKVEFPIFETEDVNKEYTKSGNPPKFSRVDELTVNREDVWYFLRNSELRNGKKGEKIDEAFKTFLVNQGGIPDYCFIRFGDGKDSQRSEDGGNPYSKPFDPIEDEIKLYLDD